MNYVLGVRLKAGYILKCISWEVAAGQMYPLNSRARCMWNGTHSAQLTWSRGYHNAQTHWKTCHNVLISNENGLGSSWSYSWGIIYHGIDDNRELPTDGRLRILTIHTVTCCVSPEQRAAIAQLHYEDAHQRYKRWQMRVLIVQARDGRTMLWKHSGSLCDLLKYASFRRSVIPFLVCYAMINYAPHIFSGQT